MWGLSPLRNGASQCNSGRVGKLHKQLLHLFFLLLLLTPLFPICSFASSRPPSYDTSQPGKVKANACLHVRAPAPPNCHRFWALEQGP